MAARTVEIAFLGSTADLERALERAGITAEVAGKKIGDTFNEGTSRAATGLGKLSNLGASWGVPFMGSLDKIGEKLDQAETKTARFSTALQEAGKVTALAGTAGFAVAAGEAVKLGEKFQSTTASIAANAGITQKAATNIGNAFLDTAGKSIFSGQEMASAFQQVAGQLKLTEGHALSTAEATKVMTSASNLAEAANTDLGSSTSALAGVMQAYHLSVNQAASASDTLFNISKSINVPLDGVATALERLHGRLGELAPSLTDVGALMDELAGHGVTGQRGVQVVNTALQTLVGNSAKTDAVLKALGVSVFDSSGHFVGLESVISQLQPKLKDLTQQQQIYVTQTLFGKSAAQVMNQVIADGIPGYQKAADTVNKVGTAQSAAELHSKTLHNEMETLKATVEDLGTKLGLFLIPALQKLGSWLADGVNWLEKHKAAAIALGAAIAGPLGLAVAAFVAGQAASFVGAIGRMGAGLVSLATTSKATATTVATEGDAIVASADTTAAGVDVAIGSTGIGLVLIGLSVAVAELATHWSTAMDSMKAAVQTMANDAISVLNSLISVFNSTIGQVTGDIGQLNSLGGSANNLGPGQSVTTTDAGGSSTVTQLPPLNIGGRGKGGATGPGGPWLGAGGQVTPSSFAASVLSRLGIKPTTQNIQDFTAWESQEGGNWANNAKYNPLNTTMSEPGAGNTGSQGNIKVYTSWAQGLAATVATLKLSAYKGIVDALSGNASPSAFSAAVAGSPWGTGAINAQGTTLGNSAIQTLINQTASGKSSTKSVKSLLYANPFQGDSGVTQGRTDEGVDFTAAAGTAIHAIGAGTITRIIQNWFAGQPMVQETLTSGPNAGKIVYYAEQLNSLVKQGQRVAAGQTIGTVAQHGTGLELGFGSNVYPHYTLAAATTGYTEGQQTPAGKAFAAWLRSIGSGTYTTTSGGITTGGGAGSSATIAQAIQSFITALDKTTTSLIQSYQSLEQSGTVKTLTKALGVTTGGGVAQALQVKIEGLDPAQVQKALTAGTDPTQLDKTLIPLLEKASSKSQATQTFNTLVAELRGAGQGGQANALISARGGTFATLAQEMYAQQILKDAESLQLQATQEKDRTTIAANEAAKVLQIQKDTQQLEADRLSQMVTAIKDMTQTLTDRFAAMVTAIQDKTTEMADASNAVVQGINDNTQVQVDILGERGLFGLNLIAQQQQVQLDVMKAGFDQQIAQAQTNLDVVKATEDQIVAQKQLQVDQITAAQDQLVALAQARADTAQLHADQKVGQAQAHADSVTLAQDVATQLAQTAVDLSANAPKAQQDAANAQLKRATAAATLAEANATATLTSAQSSANTLVAQAQAALTEAQGKAALAEGSAQQALATAQGQANTAIAQATQALQGVQDTAAQQEAALQGEVSITQARASTQFAGSGLTVNLYGIPLDNAAAIGTTMDWFARTQLGALS